MHLIASIDSNFHCHVGHCGSDEAWLESAGERPCREIRNEIAGRLLNAEDIVSEYLRWAAAFNAQTIYFKYASDQVRRFFEAECVNKQLLVKYTPTTP
jgi:hypothetical protein